MKQKIRKFISLLLVSLFLFNTSTFAAEITSDSSDTNSATTQASARKAIVIIPGISGSTLRNADTKDVVWLHATRHQQLVCTETGATNYNIESFNDDNYGTFDTYNTLYNSLRNAFEDEYEIIFFDYDWRMSNTTTASNLATELAPYSEVVLVAHSMGGLVAGRYLTSRATNRNKVSAFISLGTPYVGAAKTIQAMESGEFLDVFIIGDLDIVKSSVKNICTTINGAFQLLPTSNYYSKTSTYPIAVGSTNYSSTQALSFMKSRSWGKKQDGSAKPMFTTASTFHNSMFYNDKHATELSGIPTWTFAGTGLDTVSTVKYTTSGATTTPATSNAGDGTVLVKSAGYGTPDYTYSGVSHISLAKNSTVISRVISCISSATGATARASSVLPTADTDTREYTADELEFNDRGWLLNEDTKRINVVSSNNDIDISINGKPIIVRGDQLFVTDSNGCEEYVGMTCTFNENGETLFTLIDDDYDIQIDSDTDSIRVEYVDAGYYEKVVEYSDLLQGTVYQLTVKNHQLMDTNCHSQAINSANVQSIDVAPTHVATPTELSTLNDG